MVRANRQSEEVMEVRRKAGRLRRITTSAERSYLILDEPGNARYLECGAVLKIGDLEELEGPLAQAAGLIFAYNLLSRRDRSEAEIRNALAKEGIENKEVIDYIVGALRRQGYVNDRRLASGFVDYRKKCRPAGPGLIRRKLRDAGIDDEIIESEIARNFTDGDEKDMALALAKTRFSGMKGLSRESKVRRINGFLARRGFSRTVVNDICAGILRGEISGEDT